jgi:hypothetical protein
VGVTTVSFPKIISGRNGGAIRTGSEWGSAMLSVAAARDTLNVYGASDYAVTSHGGDYTAHVVIGVDPENRMYLLDLWRGQQWFGNVRFGALCGLKSDVALLRTENRRRGRVRICRSFGWPAHPTLGRMFARANLHLALVAVMCCPTVHLTRNTQIGIR